MKRLRQTVLTMLVMMGFLFPEQGFAFFKVTSSVPATVTSGQGMLFFLNVHSGTSTQLSSSAQPASSGVNRTLSVNLGQRKAGVGLTTTLPSVIRIENKSGALLTTSVSIENGTSPNPTRGLTSFINMMNLNLSAVKGETIPVSLNVNSGAGMPLGVYTGFLVLNAGILLPTESLRIPITIQLY